MQARYFCTLALLLTCLIGLPRTARAQDKAGELAAAQALFDEGMRLFGQQHFPESCAKFEASLALNDAIGTRGKLAECYEKVDRIASAWAMYREVAVLAKRASQPQREQAASERAARLEAELSFLTVTVPTEARIPGLEIRHNGVLLSPGAYGTAIAADPGEQAVAFTAPDHQSIAMSVTLGKRDKKELIVPVLKKVPDKVEPAPVKTEPAPAPAVSKPPMPAKKEPKNPLRIVGITSAAVGGGALVLGAVLALKANRDYDTAFDDGLCDADKTCTPAGLTAVDDARSLGNLGTVFAVSGTVLVGVGAYLWLRSPSERTGDDQVVYLAPTAAADSLGFALGGSF